MPRSVNETTLNIRGSTIQLRTDMDDTDLRVLDGKPVQARRSLVSGPVIDKQNLVLVCWK